MKRVRTLLLVVAAIVLAAGLGTAYYWTAWQTAHTAAVELVLGRDAGPLAADPFWAGNLGPAQASDLDVTTNAGWVELSTRLTVNFSIRNKRSPAHQVPLGIDLQWTPGGWQIIGAGTGG